MSLSAISRGLNSIGACVTYIHTVRRSGFTGLNTLIVRTMSSQEYKFETLQVSRPREYVVQVQLNRPDKRNAINKKMYTELRECFTKLADDADCRAIVLSGAGKIFCAGIDVMDLSTGISGSEDVARRAFQIRKYVQGLQDSHTAMEKGLKPVIAAIHGHCVGGGIDMVTACDIRYCTQDASFSIKEVDVGLAADLGTLQRLPKVVGNDSLVRELCYTSRPMLSDEAKQSGLVSRVFADQESLLAGALEVAKNIASKSPVAVQGTKINLNYSRDHSVEDGLDYVLTWNTAMLQGEDLIKAATAAMQKEKPTFSKL